MYSLGLILLALFYPTKNSSELSIVLKNAKEEILPLKLTEFNTEIAEIIKKLISKTPEKRPDINMLLYNSILSEVPRKITTKSIEDNLFVKKENMDRWKTRYVKLVNGALYIYKKRGDPKARICYSLLECSVLLKFQAHILENVIVCIEHKCIETIYLRLRLDQAKDWLEFLNITKAKYISQKPTFL